MAPFKPLASPRAFLPELKRIKDTIKCVALGAKVPGQRYCVFVETHFITPIPDCEKSIEWNWVSDQTCSYWNWPRDLNCKPKAPHYNFDNIKTLFGTAPVVVVPTYIRDIFNHHKSFFPPLQTHLGLKYITQGYKLKQKHLLSDAHCFVYKGKTIDIYR